LAGSWSSVSSSRSLSFFLARVAMAHATNGNATGKSTPPSFWRQAALLLACALGIYATFLGYGILQERMSDTQSTNNEGANERASAI
jgi:hypothetical protein